MGFGAIYPGARWVWGLMTLGPQDPGAVCPGAFLVGGHRS